jgi:hypothetical protein
VSSYIAFTGMLGIPIAIWRVGSAQVCFGMTDCCSFCLPLMSIVFWLSRFRLDLGDETITYSSLFRGYRSIPRSDLVKADFAAETSAYESPFTFVFRSSAADASLP